MGAYHTDRQVLMYLQAACMANLFSATAATLTGTKATLR